MNLPALKSSVTSSESEPAVRPKVLRRPAQFSGGTVSPKVPASLAVATLPAQVTAPTPAPPHTRPWQEDSRFGMALIGLLVLVNVVLMLWLPGVAIHPRVSGATATILAGRESPGSISKSAITLYAQPLPPALSPANLREPVADTIMLPPLTNSATDRQAH